MQIAAPCVSVFCCSCVCGSLNIPANFSSFFLSTHLAAALPREAGLDWAACSAAGMCSVPTAKGAPGVRPRTPGVVWVKRQLKRRRLSSSVPCQNRGGCIACRVGSHSLINIRPTACSVGWFVKKYYWLVCVREKYCSGWKFTIVYDKPQPNEQAA